LRILNWGSSAFGTCWSLKSVRIPASIEPISLTCFNDGPARIVLEPGCKLSARSVGRLRLDHHAPIN
jgi:hypothetical protein